MPLLIHIKPYAIRPRVVHYDLMDYAKDQFGKYLLTRKESDDDRMYALWKHAPEVDDQNPWIRSGTMSVDHHPRETGYRYPVGEQSHYKGMFADTGEVEHMGPPDQDWDHQVRGWENSKYYRKTYLPTDHQTGQEVLFAHYDSGPAKDVVEVMALDDESDRGQAMTMLGVAKNDSDRKGVPLKPSTDLSQHSSKLVGKLKDKGIVDASAPSNQTNDLTFKNYSMPLNRYKTPNAAFGAPVPREEIDAGRKTVRNMIHEGRMSRQFGGVQERSDTGEQLQIPGV